VESTLFRARRRLEREYEEIEAGRRCEAIEQAIARISEGIESQTDMRRLTRHARGCSNCRRRARQMGVEPLRSRRAAARAAAVLPIPGFLRRRFAASQATPPPAPEAGTLANLVTPTAHVGAAVAERAAALVAAAALAGAGGAMLSGAPAHHRGVTPADHGGAAPHVRQHHAPAARQQSRGRSGTPEAGRQGDWRSRSRSDAAPRTGKPRSKDPAASGGAGSGLSGPGSIEPPAAPAVPSAPRVRIAPPAKPALPDASVDAPAAAASIVSPPATLDVLQGVGSAGA
jgi:hypothetical protein